MFDYYQVEHIHMSFYPYKWETQNSNTGVSEVNARPVYSCVDPETTTAGTASGIASYGNMHVSAAYATHSRSLPYHALGIQKQETVILATNGAAASRAVYTEPTNIQCLMQSPALTTKPIGMLVFTIRYVFSGQHNPNVGIPMPLPVGVLTHSE